jgi:hypothetical protein
LHSGAAPWFVEFFAKPFYHSSRPQPLHISGNLLIWNRLPETAREI